MSLDAADVCRKWPMIFESGRCLVESSRCPLKWKQPMYPEVTPEVKPTYPATFTSAALNLTAADFLNIGRFERSRW